MKFLILSLLVALAVAEKVRYDGYQTLRIEPKGEIQNDYIHHLAESLDEEFDFWAQVPNGYTDVMMPPNLIEGFKNLLESHDVDYQVMIEDVQALIDDQANVEPSATFYETYHTYDEIQQWVSDMASSYSIATKFQIATSFEGRAINALKISSGGFGKKAVYWQGGIHAREWISPATLMYMTNQMLSNSNGDFKKYFDEFDFYIVPSLNVDGYVYTHTNDRMWRKTRNTNGGAGCKGVDPNRNYDYRWGGSGSSGSKCSETYRGTSTHTEPEVADSTSYLKNLGQTVTCFIDFHAYSQLWLSPWSYSKTAVLPSETNDQVAAGEAACSALQSVHGTSYTSGPSARTLYAADGCSVDWGFGNLGAKYSYVVELRDTGRYGFVLPENQILPTGEETYAGVKAMLDYIIINN